MPSRSLDDLDPVVESRARDFLRRCEIHGIDVLIYCTRRTLEEQAQLYRIGRDLPGKRVTNAKPGESAHNFGLAFDCVPMVQGKPQWSATHPLWTAVGPHGEAAGLEWAGRWTRFREFPHFQMPNWRRYVQ